MAKKLQTMDGNYAAAYISYAFTEVAGIFPITPSSVMAEHVDEWAAKGKKNIFGQPMEVVELQSEAGAAGTVHGSLAAGALTTTYTASQGLLLMIPNMYKIAGELLPGVIHCSARALAGHALSIFGDHSDVMACRQTGFALLAANNVQEIMDLSAVAHLSAIKGRVPFLHFFDGFRTSHETQKIETIDYEDLDRLVDHEAIQTFRDNALNPEHPVLRGTAQNPDIFFQGREASNKFYNDLPKIVEGYMEEINKITGREYGLFNYYGSKDAEKIIIAMGSGCDVIEETIDHLIAGGEKVGLVKVRLYRPFVMEKFLDAIPATATKIAVLDRTKEPGSLGEPLYQDVCTAFYEADRKSTIVGGRYGLGSKDFTPAQVLAVYDNLKQDKPKNHFTVGIVDDVTFTSLEVGAEIDTTPVGTTSCKFWGLGSDGTVGANQNSIKIIGDHTDLFVQAYFSYDSKKSGGITTSHLRFGAERIRSSYLVNTADFVACHNPSYVDKYDMVSDLKEGGSFLLNCGWSPEEVGDYLPAKMKNQLANKNIHFYITNATHIAEEIGLGNRINTVLQSAFFKITEIIPYTEAVGYMKDAAKASYSRYGDDVVNMNYQAIDRGGEGIVKVEIPVDWKTTNTDPVSEYVFNRTEPAFVTNIVHPINAQEGDKLPVSAFAGREDGTFPQGTAAFEKRGIAVNVPTWVPENCIQCNQCAYVCPHAAIRPFLLTDEEAANAPEGYEVLKGLGKGVDQYKFRVQLSVMDCAGCGSCAEVCPSKVKSLVMKPIDTQMEEAANWYYSVDLPHKDNPWKVDTVKGSQFEQPLLEFSGACAGCGETPYAKLVTQLFGDRMFIANATGCTSIWGGSAPSTPYTTNQHGHGPAWANSLFEDNAEFGLGMLLAVKQRRDKMKDVLTEIAQLEANYAEIANEWVASMDDTEKSIITSDTVREMTKSALAGELTPELTKLFNHVKANDDVLVKKSQWIFGGDGWAYDIGYGGLDHVLASGENVNVLVFDTEVYSNTGGQSSKSTPTAAVAKFAASGKKIRKKDLGMMAMSYGYVYVAQVGMGANQTQTLRALKEAEAYDGPSLVIAYSPCINHGIKGGLTHSQKQIKEAVEAGYWHLYRYNPALKAENKNPFILDSKEPTGDFKAFIGSESRYTSLKRSFPELADELFDQAASDAVRRLDSYKRLAAGFEEPVEA